ncbi:GNAT family N-acetyltransferase [Xylophilus rhododendri]|uniref:GNAT family N-acetyltransferase n=1 Tax=Xylophilus rhododendri TaxID=2697032 RepID=A0A857IZX8_9BURK|nr:GNAT family N-acetyltransferase [Xylophilus rhododendri]QHI97026.1 GNAT family N-acetyltransferase [Xylophilus rhododendri]
MGAAPIDIVQGYHPGALGRIVEMHALFYAAHAGFGQVFESQVACGLAEFAGRLGDARNGLWTAVSAGRVVGSVAIDGKGFADGHAHLRWFIVDGGQRGGGLGKALLQRALAFCDEHRFAETRLWTFEGLDAARRLYEAQGFVLKQQQAGAQWGSEVQEQLFVRQQGPA